MDRDIALSYERKKKRNKRAAIISGICSIGITIFLIIAFCLIYVDRFTITTSTNDLSLTIDKEQYTTQLVAPPLLSATDIQYYDVPENIDEALGSKNVEKQYFAYSFLLKAVNAENEPINYEMTLALNRFSNELEQAIKIMVIRNGTPTIYAARYSKAQAKNRNNPNVSSEKLPYLGREVHEGDIKLVYSGDRIPGQAPNVVTTTVPFKNNAHIILEPYCIVSGEYDKYTVVMWIDGWESVNSMKEGVFQIELKFSTLSKIIKEKN